MEISGQLLILSSYDDNNSNINLSIENFKVKDAPDLVKLLSLAENNIKDVKCIDYPELGMEAIWKIKVINFPAFLIIDDKGNDFYSDLIN